MCCISAGFSVQGPLANQSGVHVDRTTFLRKHMVLCEVAEVTAFAYVQAWGDTFDSVLTAELEV